MDIFILERIKFKKRVKKWENVKSTYKDIKLHFIGKLQSNKVKFALPIFDYIHSLDNLKLAEKISSYQKKINFRPKIFIQVNIGNEVQKNGIDKNDLKSFFNKCLNDFDLDIIGLMCIPPNDSNTEKYFKEMKKLSHDLSLKDLSMGMSEDYKIAINNGSTFIRVGSKIFGPRSK